MRLEVDQLTVAYGDSVVLRDVSLVVPAGRIVALLGANGAGKTTLLRTVSGLVTPRSGHVSLDRSDVTGWASDRLARRGLCYIPEEGNIFRALSVADNLRMYAARGDELDAIDRVITAFPRLGQRLGQTASTLSGGEQQMLALGRAYARRMPLVLLDEVSMGLAPLVANEILTSLALLAQDGTSVLIVEQYVAKALALADLVYILNQGRIVHAGEARELVGTDVFSHYLGVGV